jgi:ABC-type proline/glycine betaine transport system permease subunit
MTLLDSSFLPTVPLGDWFASVVDWINDNLGPVLDFIQWLLEPVLYDNIYGALHWVPPLVMAVLLGLLGLLARGWKFGLATLVGMLLIQTFATAPMWTRAMETLSLVIVASVFAMILAVPLGILAARNSLASSVIRPAMDFMQTMPAFVYLIPTLFFFSIGVVPGIVSTIVFAMPPGVRLTELGIRQVDKEMVEAGHAFGAPPRQILTRIQIPLAMPTIMAGVNQVIMLSLSMVVIAGIVGAGGLGGEVLSGITRLDLGKGFEAGVSVVILAIYLDRLTAALGARSADTPKKKARLMGRGGRRSSSLPA